MDVEWLIVLGAISTVINAIFIYIGKNSANITVKVSCGLIIFVILFADFLPFIGYVRAPPTPENIGGMFEDLAAFLVASIGSALVYPFLPKT